MHAASLSLIYFVLAWALAQNAEDDFPIVAPARFSKVVGEYDISASASTVEVRVEEPLTLTVRIKGAGPAMFQPERANLKLFPDSFGADFYVTPAEQDQRTPDGKTWEFVYRLRPKREDVALIPGLQLMYYAPARKKFESSFSDEIPIKVMPKSPSTQNLGLKIIRAPERFYKLRPIEEVVRDDSPLPAPGPALLAALVAFPPLACFGWYRLWRKLYPNAAEQRARQQSRAARRALAYLQKQHPDPPRTRAAAIDYLRQRFDLSATEATPREVAIHLKRIGLSKSVVNGWEIFLQSCDQVRFGPRGAIFQSAGQTERLSQEAIRLIQAVEGEPCAAC